jgi:hypothetical protein
VGLIKARRYGVQNGCQAPARMRLTGTHVLTPYLDVRAMVCDGIVDKLSVLPRPEVTTSHEGTYRRSRDSVRVSCYAITWRDWLSVRVDTRWSNGRLDRGTCRRASGRPRTWCSRDPLSLFGTATSRRKRRARPPNTQPNRFSQACRPRGRYGDVICARTAVAIGQRAGEQVGDDISLLASAPVSAGRTGGRDGRGDRRYSVSRYSVMMLDGLAGGERQGRVAPRGRGSTRSERSRPYWPGDSQLRLPSYAYGS